MNFSHFLRLISRITLSGSVPCHCYTLPDIEDTSFLLWKESYWFAPNSFSQKRLRNWRTSWTITKKVLKTKSLQPEFSSYGLVFSLVDSLAIATTKKIEQTKVINYFRSSKYTRSGRVVLEDLGFSGITALVLTYLWAKCPSAGLIVTDLPPIQRYPQPYAAEILIIYTSVSLVSFLVSMWSSALLFNDTLDRTIANSH